MNNFMQKKIFLKNSISLNKAFEDIAHDKFERVKNLDIQQFIEFMSKYVFYLKSEEFEYAFYKFFTKSNCESGFNSITLKHEINHIVEFVYSAIKESESDALMGIYFYMEYYLSKRLLQNDKSNMGKFEKDVYKMF